MGAIYLNNIRYGGLSGFPERDQVYVDPKVNSGTKIAEITVNDETKALYSDKIVPNPVGTPVDELVTININDRVYELAGGNVMDVYVNGASALDANDIAQINSYEEVTQAEYDALPASKLTNNVLYAIKDAGGSGGGGASAIADLDDVDLTNLSNGQILKYNSTSQKWVNADESGGGGSNVGKSILPWKNITPAQYSALSTAEKNNGVIYLVSSSAQGASGFMTQWKSVTSAPSTSDSTLYLQSSSANGAMGVQMVESTTIPTTTDNIPYLVEGV